MVLILSILLVKSTFSSCFSSIFDKKPMSIGWKLSIVLNQILCFGFILNRRTDNINVINLIPERLNFAIITARATGIIAGINAISAPTLGQSELKIIYPIPQPIIMMVRSLRLNQRSIGSSFSIWTGILYCIRRGERIFVTRNIWKSRAVLKNKKFGIVPSTRYRNESPIDCTNFRKISSGGISNF